jgi:hypothetical protein
VSILGIIASSKLGIAPIVPSFESIATETLSALTPSVTFSSIPATFTHLQLRCLVARSSRNRIAGSGADLKISYNWIVQLNYSFHSIITGLGANPVQAAAGANATSGNYQTLTKNTKRTNTAATDIFAGMVSCRYFRLYKHIRINTKQLSSLDGYDRNGAGEISSFSRVIWYASPACNHKYYNYRQQRQRLNLNHTHQFALYGIKERIMPAWQLLMSR